MSEPLTRCHTMVPSPYLVSSMKYFPKQGSVLDLGCGNGRNSEYMIKAGYNRVQSIDTAPGYDKRINIDISSILWSVRPFDIILANYVFMLLKPNEYLRTVNNINKFFSKPGTILLAELYKAKHAKTWGTKLMMEKFTKKDWIVIKESKYRFLLKRGGEDENKARLRKQQ